MSPVPWPGERQLVSRMLTGPQGSKSGPVPNSTTLMLHRVACPVLVTVAYQTILEAIVLQSGANVATGVLPLTETNFWQAMLAGITTATALVVALTEAPFAWT